MTKFQQESLRINWEKTTEKYHSLGKTVVRMATTCMCVSVFQRVFNCTRHLAVLQLLIIRGLKTAAFRLIRENPGNNSAECSFHVSVLKAIKNKYSHYWDFQEVCQKTKKL